MEQPFVSFIVPVYKAEKFLERCMQSITRQKFQEWELIFVDDESPDKSGMICEEWARQDARIKVIHRKNGGQGAARNTGARAAKGEWLMFVDDDDWLDENMYAECAPYLEDDIDILAFGRCDVYERAIRPRYLNAGRTVLSFETADEKRALQINMLNFFSSYKYALNKVLFAVPWGKFIKRSFWLANKLAFIEGYGEDRPCMLKAYGCAGKILYLDKCYYNYYIHESTMRKYLNKAYEKYDMSLKYIHEYVRTNLSDSRECIEALYHTDVAYFSYYVLQDYCHRLNPQSYLQRKERFQHDIKRDTFEDSFKKADLSCLPFRRRLLAVLIRSKSFLLMDVMCKVNDIYNKIMYNK